MVAVFLTQPEPRVGQLASRLAMHGAEPVLLTFSRLVARPEGLASLGRLDLSRTDRIVFVSPTSVSFAAPLLPAIHAACPDGLAAIGAGTAAALAELLPGAAVIRPESPPFDADALSAMPSMQPARVRSLVVIRGDSGREDWIAAYEQAGTHVVRIALYETQDTQPLVDAGEQVQAAADSGLPALTLVTTVGLARRLVDWLGGLPSAAWFREQACLTAHPRIRDHLQLAGFTRASVAPGDESLTAAAVKWLNDARSP